jgi:hypothetical protein
MREPMHRPIVKYLAMLGAVILVSVSFYASRASVSPAPTQDKAAAPTARAVTAANAFLDSLDANVRRKAMLDFQSPMKRKGWSNLPVTMVPRSGVRLGDLTKDQRKAAMDTMAAVLSKDGYQKVVDIIDGDQQLAEGNGGKAKGGKGGKGGKAMFGADQYYIAIFGKPSVTDPWMVQFGGHHLGVNVTVIGKNFILTPTHTGAQPDRFMRSGKEVRPLGLENDAAFKLVNALDENQRAQAIIGKSPKNLALGPGQDDKKIEPQGIKGSALTAPQQATLLELIGAWVNIVEGDAASKRMAEIKTQLGETYFAWSGPTEKGSAVYFRVQGPTLLIEYAPQGDVTHIHTIIRNPEDDYGEGLLKR